MLTTLPHATLRDSHEIHAHVHQKYSVIDNVKQAFISFFCCIWFKFSYFFLLDPFVHIRWKLRGVDWKFHHMPTEKAKKQQKKKKLKRKKRNSILLYTFFNDPVLFLVDTIDFICFAIPCDTHLKLMHLHEHHSIFVWCFNLTFSSIFSEFAYWQQSLFGSHYFVYLHSTLCFVFFFFKYDKLDFLAFCHWNEFEYQMDYIISLFWFVFAGYI